MVADLFTNQYLRDYMAMVEDTESPRIFHVWSALFAISAALGSKCQLPFGVSNIKPNQYVLLIGTPGTRKSTAMNLAKKLLRKSTGVRFAPSDTGFQRQGLAKALLGSADTDTVVTSGGSLDPANDSISGLTQLQNLMAEADTEEGEAHSELISDKHHLVIAASEFTRIIGQNNGSMLDFLGDRYDGEPYEYRTNQSSFTMKQTLMNMLACSTPISIANSMPSHAGGQGLLSRLILVYGGKRYKRIARPAALPEDLQSQVQEVLTNVYYNLSGDFSETPEAFALTEELYDRPLDIADPRFIYYGERRFTHFLKIGMLLAASRNSMTIEREDYEEAEKILRATERGMPDALGEFGLNPLAQLKQEILEQLRAAQGPMDLEQLVGLFHRDARTKDIAEVVMDLVNAKQILVSQTATRRMYSAVYRRQSQADEFTAALSEK